MVDEIKTIIIQSNILVDVLVDIVVEYVYRIITVNTSPDNLMPKSITFYNNYMYIFDITTNELTKKNIDSKKIDFPLHKNNLFERFVLDDNQIYVLAHEVIRIYDTECNFLGKITVKIPDPIKILIHYNYIYVFGLHNIEKINLDTLLRKVSVYAPNYMMGYNNIIGNFIYIVYMTLVVKFDLNFNGKSYYPDKTGWCATCRTFKDKDYHHTEKYISVSNTYTDEFIERIDNRFVINSMHYHNDCLYVYSDNLITIYGV